MFKAPEVSDYKKYPKKRGSLKYRCRRGGPRKKNLSKNILHFPPRVNFGQQNISLAYVSVINATQKGVNPPGGGDFFLGRGFSGGTDFAFIGLSALAVEAYGFTLVRLFVRSCVRASFTPYLEIRASDFDDFLHKATS